MDKTVRIAVANQKGGLGKTTVSVFLSRCFSETMNKHVLFVDLDVQGNSSYTLSDFDSKVKASDFLSKALSDDELNQIAELANTKGLALLYASPELANDGLTKDGKEAFNPVASVKFFNNNLAKIEKNFDMVIIDTPPTLGNKLIISLMISNHVLIPLEMDSFALQGLSRLIQTITTLKRLNYRISILGLVVNKFMANRKRQLNVFETIKNSPLGKLVCENKIRFRDCISDALSAKISLTSLRKTKGYSSKSFTSAIEDFKALSTELLAKL